MGLLTNQPVLEVIMAESDSTFAERKCPKCGGTKFQKVSGRCCGCAKALKDAWVLKNAEHIAEYREKNRQRDRAKEAEYRKNHPEKIAASREKFLADNPGRHEEIKRAYYDRNVELCKERSGKSFRANRERCLQLQKEWMKNHPEKARAINSRRYKNQIATPLGKLKTLMRTRIGGIFKKAGYRKNSRTHEILGCEYEHFVKHIESQFTVGMCWEKMGAEIHIDHKIPLASATCESDLIRLNHYTNLRPLWALDNMKKGARLDYHL